MVLLLNKDGFEPALKNMTSRTVASVDGLGVTTVQLSYTGGEIRIGGLNKYMVEGCNVCLSFTDTLVNSDGFVFGSFGGTYVHIFLFISVIDEPYAIVIKKHIVL